MGRSPTGQRLAEEFLLRLSDQPRTAVGVADLASRAGVSYVTMWKAVKRFKASGALQGGYRVTPNPGHVPSSTNAQEDEPCAVPHKRIQDQFTRDLLRGAILRGASLLSVKELTARYHTSPRSLRRVLAGAMEQGLIAPQGRHWSAFGTQHPRHQPIVLVGFSLHEGSPELPSLERDFLRALGVTCVHAQVPLRLAFIRGKTSKDGTFTMKAGEKMPPAGDGVAGYVCLVHSPEVLSPTVLHALIATGKPVAILDNGANVLHVAFKGAAPRNVRIFSASAHRQSGIDAAVYALSKGHRHVAYISPFHADSWSQFRYDGISNTINKAGNGYSLKRYSVPRSLKDHHYANQGAAHCNGEMLEQSLEQWCAQAPDSFRTSFAAVNPIFAHRIFMYGEIILTMEKLLDEAAQDPRITIWILANDLTARMALDYCARKGIAVPARVAIMGFDDEIESCEQGLTSYNFNFESAATTVAHYILHPLAGHWVRRQTVNLRGTMMARATA